MYIFVRMFDVAVPKGVFSDEVMVKLWSDFSRFSSDADSTPGNVEVVMIGVDDGDGSIGINLVLSIKIGLVNILVITSHT